ncbi:MAG: tetratricopeptide repeat protein [Deferrisomatales bacterium]
MGFLAAGLAALLAAAPAAPSFVVGREPAPPGAVVRVDDRRQALLEWARLGGPPLPVVFAAPHPGFGKVVPAAGLEPLRRALDARDWPTAGNLLAAQGSPVSDENFLWAAGGLVLVGPVTWVVPTREPLDDAALLHLRELLGTRSLGRFDPAEVAGLRRDGGVVAGTLHGVPLRVTTLRDLVPPDGPVLLHLDLGSVLAHYEQDFSTPALQELGTFFAAQRTAGLRAARVTIAQPVRDQAVPLKFRYLGAWLQALLESPALFDQPPPEAWLLQKDAELLDAGLDLAGAEANYRLLAAAMPRSAAVRFSLARNLFLQERFDDCFALLGEAADLDPAYALGFVKMGIDFERKGWREGADRLYREARRRLPGDPGPLLALGHLHRDGGRPAEAIGFYREARALAPGAPDAAVHLADALLAAGRPAEAIPPYREALAADPGYVDQVFPEVRRRLAEAEKRSGRAP